jgi:hypothetical protein
MRVLANPIQSSNLEEIFKHCRPEKRLAIAAVILDVSVSEILVASGMSERVAAYHMTQGETGRSNRYLRSDVMRDVARVLGVPLQVLWDDEALDNPMMVLRSRTRVFPGNRKFSEARSQRMKERHRKKREEKNEEVDVRSDVSNVRCIDDARKCG